MSYSMGDVVRYRNPEFPEKIHAHIVVAQKDNINFVVCCSSKIENTLKICKGKERPVAGSNPRTYVYVPPGSSATLSTNLAIDCNKVFPHNFTKLKGEPERDFRAQLNDRINPDILRQIKEAIKHSKMVSDEIKSLL